MTGRRATYLVIVLCVPIVAACATISAGSDYDQAADFAKFHRYVWVAESPLIRAESGRVDLSPLTVRRVREAIERELAAKSFELAATREEADFAVSFTVGARDMITLDDYPPYYRGDWQWGSPYYWPHVDVAMYTEGMLAIDVFDNATRAPVWHGWARKTIVQSDIKDPQASIDAAVDAILADFPPR